ncbi:LysR family transcriptional regulator [Marinosulfonomonas sp. PRT-SC04]|nr:LysR family transcriptional regulator [Marinosulfonomonas sp. PRT-SC04]
MIFVFSKPSLAAAARALNVTPPAVTQRLAQIEQKLHLKLAERGASGLRLTAEGGLLAERGAAILNNLDGLAEELAERRDVVAGPLRIVAPFGFGRLKIAPLLAAFSLDHPELVPSLILTEDPRGAMRADPWDVLIHVGRLPDLGVVQKRLVSNRRLLCAAPSYVSRYGLPEAPNDLSAHRIGVVREDQADVTLWSLTDTKGAVKSVRIDPRFESNDGEVIRGWALEGLGIIERSEWSVAADLRAGRLLAVLPDWTLPNADVVALLNHHSVRTTRIEAFLSYLERNLVEVF